MRWASASTCAATSRPADPMGELLIGIDVGTASTKGVLLRPDGSSVADARADHDMSIPRPGWAEQDADGIWWADVVAVARRLTAAVPAGDRIAGIAVSAIGPTLVALDADERPLRPGILYGVDTRATEQIAALEARYGTDALEALAGMALSSQAIGPKIAWLVEHEPEVAARARWYVTASTYLVLRLTGALVIDAHTASHWNPLFDPSTMGWTDRFADGITTLERLPPVGWPTDVAGVVSPAAAAETGLPSGTPVAVGTVDALAEAISVGVSEPGDLMLMYGSTTFLILITERAMRATPLWSTAGPAPGTWALAAGLATGGSALAWFRDRFAPDLVAAEAHGGRNAFAALGLEATGEANGPTPIVLPYLSGERTPINDPLARGVIAGLSLQTGRGDVYRGLVDGIALAVRANVEAMRVLGAPIHRAVAVGGGTADRRLLQAVSDATDLSQALPVSTIGAARGDAFIAGLASGRLQRADLASWVEVTDQIQPDPQAVVTVDGAADRFQRLYRDTREVIHEHAAGGAGR